MEFIFITLIILISFFLISIKLINKIQTENKKQKIEDRR